MVVLEFIALVSSILYIGVVDFRAQYPQCVTLESFIILKLPLQHGADFYWEDTGMAEYKPTKFKLKTSHYDKAQADFAVGFIECLCHTKGRWAGKPFKLLPWQEQIVRDIFGTLKADGNRQFTTAYIEIPKKNGKQLSLDTPIPTPDGWSTMGELKIGDTVFDEKGRQCHVVAKSDVDDTEQAYRLTFRDGSEIIAGANHLWDVDYIIGKTHHKIMRTEDIYNKTVLHNNRQPHDKRSVIRIRVNRALHTRQAMLPISPYLYGFWLGNGNAVKPEITVRTCDIDDIKSFIGHEISSWWMQKGEGSAIFRIPDLKAVLVKSFRDKAISTKYLRASQKQRWELLQGLMDSDGCIGTRKAQSVYVTTIKQLAESVRELLWSLGIKNAMMDSPSTRCGKPTGETLYQIRFTTFDDQPVSKLNRKISRKRERVKDTRSCFHYMKNIELLSYPVKMQCIQVDSKSHCYLAGKSMVPTHNSELAAAIALYMLFADGEASPEVYGAAADRQQAAIVFDVAHQMVNMTAALAKRSKILTANKRIVSGFNNGFYQVLSAEVTSKHGLNVSGLVFDEVHAQPNRKLYDVLTKGSGDAREQPLYFLITTAGNDTNSICYELHQKALDIIEGRKVDPTFYPVIYGASESADWTSPAVWKEANPSLGDTITMEKVQAACESAKQNPAEENSFRQLRLNQWVKQAVRWMPMEKWDACDFVVNEDELAGRVCYGGLDLSSTTDITAFVLVFPPLDEEDKYHILPYFWIPEENVDLRVRRDHVPYDLWEKQGTLLTTEGNVVHYGYIEKFIEKLNERFNIREIAYDRWGAVQMVQNLEGMGFTVVPFGQGFKDMNPPTKELMKLTLEKRIAHGGHPVLRWMMDNIFIKTDPAGNIKPDKEKSTEKIDGVVATIMALDRAIRCGLDNGESVYDERGILLI